MQTKFISTREARVYAVMRLVFLLICVDEPRDGAFAFWLHPGSFVTSRKKCLCPGFGGGGGGGYALLKLTDALYFRCALSLYLFLRHIM